MLTGLAHILVAIIVAIAKGQGSLEGRGLESREIAGIVVDEPRNRVGVTVPTTRRRRVAAIPCSTTRGIRKAVAAEEEVGGVTIIVATPTVVSHPLGAIAKTRVTAVDRDLKTALDVTGVPVPLRLLLPPHRQAMVVVRSLKSPRRRNREGSSLSIVVLTKRFYGK